MMRKLLAFVKREKGFVPRFGQEVTLCRNNSEEEITGSIIEYTPRSVILRNISREDGKTMVCDTYVHALDWHFKEDSHE